MICKVTGFCLRGHNELLNSAGSRALQAVAQDPAHGHGALSAGEDTSFPAQDP